MKVRGTKGKQIRGATAKLGSGATHVMNLPVDVFLEVCMQPNLSESVVAVSNEC